MVADINVSFATPETAELACRRNHRRHVQHIHRSNTCPNTTTVGGSTSRFRPRPRPPAPTHNAMANVHVSRMMPKVDLGGRRLQHHPPPSPLSRHWLPGAVCTCCQGCNCTRWPSVAERTVVDPARSGLPANGGHAAAAADRHGAEHPILGQPSGRGLLHRPCRHDADRATGPERLRGLGTWKP